MQHGRFLLKNNQSLVIAGCFTGREEDNAWIVNPSDITINVLAQFCSNAEEADHRIWRHATQCNANNILIYSLDTDIYNIGLSLANQPTKNYVIQLNVPHSLQTKYLILNNLKMALACDPDLSTLPDENLGAIMQTLFISTGCDCISYFKLLGKANYIKQLLSVFSIYNWT